MTDLSELIDEARFLVDDTHLTPDQFKSKYGRCPIGFNTDPATNRCAKIGLSKPGSPAAKGATAPASVTHFKKPSDDPKPADRHPRPKSFSVSLPPAKAKDAGGDKGGEHGGHGEGSLLKRALGGAWHALSDPFKKAWKLATDKKYRTEVKDFVVKACKKEGSQTKQMAQTFAKVLKGEKVSREEKLAAADQMADIVKVALIGSMVGHVAAGGIAKALATLASPADEIAGIAIDKPLRKITKKLFGREHGILPTSFYEEGVAYTMLALLSEAYKEGDEYKLIEQMVDAIVSELGKTDLSEDDIMKALMKGGLRAKKKNVIDKIIGIFSKKEDETPPPSAPGKPPAPGKKVPCAKCGGTSYNDIRGKLGDCCVKKEGIDPELLSMLRSMI